MRPQPKKNQYKIQHNVLLKNNFNTGDITGDIINEENIDGKLFYVVKTEYGRVQKVAKEAYTIRRNK